MNTLLDSPWVARLKKTHFAIEASGAGNVLIAHVRYIARPDGSTSESEAVAIAALPELVAAAEQLLRDCGFGLFVCETAASERLRAALSIVRGRKSEE